jgi:uncharacterized protein GlcG (DUF336 family)
VPVLTLEAARTVPRAAEAKAKADAWPCVISFVDSDGLPIILEPMDDAAVPGGVILAKLNLIGGHPTAAAEPVEPVDLLR